MVMVMMMMTILHVTIKEEQIIALYLDGRFATLILRDATKIIAEAIPATQKANAPIPVATEGDMSHLKR